MIKDTPRDSPQFNSKFTNTQEDIDAVMRDNLDNIVGPPDVNVQSIDVNLEGNYHVPSPSPL